MFKIHAISFTTILLMELKKIFKLINIIPIILILAFLLLPTIINIINMNIAPQSAESLDLTKTLWTLMPRLYIFLLIWKTLTDLLSTENMDKNIVVFLTNNKHIVFFLKLVSNIIIFTIPILLFICGQWFLIGVLWTGSTATGYPSMAMRMSVFYIQNTIFYAFLSLAIQFLIASYLKKWIKNLIIIFILFIMIIFYWLIPMFITLDLDNFVSKPFFNFDNSSIKGWVYYIPIVNVITIPMSLLFEMQHGVPITNQPIVEIINVLPFVIETFIMIVIIWFFITNKVKEYLCT